MNNFLVPNRHLMRKCITITILPLIFFTTTVFAQSSSNYKVIIDNCHKSIINEGTQNTITVEFLNGNRVVGKRPTKGIKECSSNAIFSIQSNENITGVNVTTTGNDAFYIDKIELYKNGELINRYGSDNGEGWCLSTDPNDANTAWKGTTENGCKASQFFGYSSSSGSSSGSSHTTLTEYKVVIDNCHSGISDEGTNNTITVEFLDGYNIVGRTSKNSIIACSANMSFSIQSYESVTGVKITTSGNDGFYIDKIELYKGGELVQSHGKDNGKGWCLSTDPDDANDGWEGTTKNGCKTSQFFPYPPSGSTQSDRKQEILSTITIYNCHDRIINEGTNNTITVEFLNGNRVVGKTPRKGIEECAYNTYFSFHHGYEKITAVRITTDGDDGFFINKAELYKGGKIVKTYGSDNGNGWCLSTDPGDANSAWKGKTVNGCNASVTFEYY